MAKKPAIRTETTMMIVLLAVLVVALITPVSRDFIVADFTAVLQWVVDLPSRIAGLF